MRMFIRSLMRKIGVEFRAFFRRLGYVTTNKMPLSSWLFTIFSLIGLLVSMGGYYWLDIVSKQYPTLTTGIPLADPLKLEPISDIRRDVDVILAIDFSASMDGEKGSDPDGLRLRAAEIMASSLAADIYPRETRMGYVEFGSNVVESQGLNLIDSNDARLQLIRSIYEPSLERKSDPNFGSYTNISATLEMAEHMFEEYPQPDSKNTPALIILTDGRPTKGYTTEEQISNLVEDLVQKKVLIFIVVLRNPHKEADNDQEIELEFENWRKFWGNLAKENPLYVEYDDAQDDTQLEFIYNKIRSRLVQEGTKLGDRILYDPSDPKAQIVMPPNLLQAQLIVNKPVGTKSVELFDPDGINFSDQVQFNSPENVVLNGNFFVRFKIAYPKTGSWKFVTDAKKPLYYLLNAESIYSARLAWPVGSPYIYKYQTSQVPFVIADEMGNIVDKPFNLVASILKYEQDETGVFVEKAYPLTGIHSDLVLDKPRYFIDVSPDDFSNESTVAIQVDGSAADGSLVNSVIIKLPVIDAPSGLNDQTASMISESCLVAKKVFWPPSLVCENKIDLSVQITGSDLLKGETVSGKIYTPFSADPLDMELENTNTLHKVLGPLQSTGSYPVVIDIGGTIDQQENDFLWNQRINKTIEIVIPNWVEIMKLRCVYTAVLFLICTLWKIVIVPILLLVFSLFRFVPDGFYSIDLTQNTGWTPVFKRAMERRKLFTLTFGYKRNVNDISKSPNVNLPAVPNKFLKVVFQYLYSAPRAHIFWIPIIGLYGEDDHGNWIKADIESTTIPAGRSQIHIKK